MLVYKSSISDFESVVVLVVGGGDLMTPFVAVPNYIASIVVLYVKEEMERIGKKAMVEYSR